VWERAKKTFTIALVGVAFAVLVGAGLELYLSKLGYGDPPLYSYDPAIGYVLKPSQDLRRYRDCKVLINSLGMRSPEVSVHKSPGKCRILVLGDSVPYGGSYIDQDDTFCYVAQRLLNRNSDRYEILNAGVNAYGPRNVLAYLETKGTFAADMIIVYFPWGNLRRDFTNFYIVPFWSNSPEWALAEFFRHGLWQEFGKFSQKWKDLHAFENESILDMNIAALEAIKRLCEKVDVPLFFFWSPYRDILMGQEPDTIESDIAKLRRAISTKIIVELGPVFARQMDIPSLYSDPCHYSREGHQLAGAFLADFIATRFSAGLSQ
jgi:hypothetical protein